MSIPRIPLPSQARTTEPADGYVLEGESFHHAIRVLRLGVGDCFRAVDGNGRESLCGLERIERRRAWARVQEQLPVTAEAAVTVSLCCALLKSDKMDLVLQKATELGVSEIVVFEARRSVRKMPDGSGSPQDPGAGSPLLRRWQRILEAAVAQSGRSRSPGLRLCASMEEATACLEGYDGRFLLWEGEATNRLGAAVEALGEARGVAVMVGPEGGFDPAEVAAARAVGWVPVTLGRRILRAETAAMVVPALVLHGLGELG